jgi:restriction endonuclease Mrr
LLSLQSNDINMEGVILHTDSNKDLDLIIQLAKKLGISARKLSKEEIEDYGLSIAINQGKTGEYVDTETYLKELRNGCKD